MWKYVILCGCVVMWFQRNKTVSEREHQPCGFFLKVTRENHIMTVKDHNNK